MPDLQLPKKRIFLQDAGVMRRVLAALCDILLLDVLVLTPFSFVFSPYAKGGFAESMSLFQSGLPSDLAFVLLFAGSAAVVYFTLFTYFFRQSFGMMLVQVHVEGDLTLKKSFIRSIIAFPFFPIYLLWIIEPLVILWKRQGLLELATGTRTVIARAM